LRVGILGDLHIGAPQSKWRDAATLLRQLAPELDALILCGDTTEELNPYPETFSYMGRDRYALQAHIKQILEYFIKQISKVVNKVLFLRGNHDDRLLNHYPLVEDYAVLQSRFGRVVILHGHQTNLSKYGLKYGWGVQAGRELKAHLELEHYCGIKLAPTDYLILGHCHVAYSDTHAKVYSPGCWVGNYRNRNTGWYLLVDDEAPTASPRTFIRLIRRIGLTAHTTCDCKQPHQRKKTHSNTREVTEACPICGTVLTPTHCGKAGCTRPLRGEDTFSCKRHRPQFRFWE